MASNDRGKRPAWTPPWRGRRVRTFACERKFRSGRVGQRIRADNSCMSAVSVCNVAYSPPQGAQYHPQHVSDIDKGIVVPLWNGPMAMLQTTSSTCLVTTGASRSRSYRSSPRRGSKRCVEKVSDSDTRSTLALAPPRTDSNVRWDIRCSESVARATSITNGHAYVEL